MQIHVRTARPEDEAAIRKVLVASYPVLMRGSYEPELLERALPRMTRPNLRLLGSGSYFLAHASEEAVGCGGWSGNAPGISERHKGVGHIRHFAITSDWIGRGIGRRIYDRCEAQAREAGVEQFQCYSSLNGEPFYAALGFERIGLIDVPMGPGLVLPSVLMKRLI